MASKSVQRSTAKLKAEGWEYSIVEKFNHFVKVRQDFGGFADILAWKAGVNGVLAVQACTTGTTGGGDLSAHVTKLTKVSPTEDPVKGQTRLRKINTWLRAGNALEIWGWGKRGARGQRKLWTLSVVRLAVTVPLESPPMGAPDALMYSTANGTPEPI